MTHTARLCVTLLALASAPLAHASCTAEGLDGKAIWQQSHSLGAVVRDLRDAAIANPKDLVTTNELDRIAMSTNVVSGFVSQLSVLYGRMRNPSDQEDIGKSLVFNASVLNDDLDGHIQTANVLIRSVRSAGVAALSVKFVDQLRALKNHVADCHIKY